MKKVMLFVVLLIAVAIAGCTQKIVCNTPYIQVGAECCLDQNANSICDKDETIEKTLEQTPLPNTTSEVKTKAAIDKEEFLVFAEKFGRELNSNDYETLYSMLTPTRKKMISQNNFVNLYPQIYGREEYPSFVLSRTEIDYPEAFAYYEITYSTNTKEVVGPFYFKQEGDLLGSDSFSAVVYEGCSTDSDCFANTEREATLSKLCEDGCNEAENTIGGEHSFKKEDKDKYRCVNKICNCKCFDMISLYDHYVLPSETSLH